MARKSHDDAFGVVGAETIIGAGVTVKGDLTSESDVIVDGKLEGTIKAKGDVTIGVNAVITAVVYGDNVTVAGHLTGDVHATGTATIRESGQVDGDVTSAGLAIIAGGIFIGRSHMPANTSSEVTTEEITMPSVDIKKRKH